MTIPAAMTPPTPPLGRGLPARIVERLRLWHERRRCISEMANAAALGRLDDLLDDAGMTRADLTVLMDGPSDAGRQFEVFAKMEGVDVRRLPAGVLREAIRVCARCDRRAPCKRWLRTGVWRDQRDSRSPNAALLHH